ncbi:hypothetical protein A2415_02420 [candidate division WWE3 bacterium RIFOXYC1_FULL_39_7]|uniref:Uncharacterized protein n=2 Tax=Katanobacteria TaxID=422282 RepID=A0A1F4X777_UNCKA|nr:MAG: hypothetical protein A2415_02420 [candidate division WWE3 bacterium RIFOXYC1_FULL_39_7]OGC77565.1 MAG: hypothetical protein A2619_01025 [candidate division WWE3 bacterium RIFOXYD1_FULL_39_9]
MPDQVKICPAARECGTCVDLTDPWNVCPVHGLSLEIVSLLTPDNVMKDLLYEKKLLERCQPCPECGYSFKTNEKGFQFCPGCGRRIYFYSRVEVPWESDPE